MRISGVLVLMGLAAGVLLPSRVDAGAAGMVPARALDVENAKNGAVRVPFLALKKRARDPQNENQIDMWFRGDLGQLRYTGSAGPALVPQVFVQPDDGTPAEAPVTPMVVRSLDGALPAGALERGRVVEILAFGTLSAGGTDPRVTLRLALDGTDLVTCGPLAVPATSDGAFSLHGTFAVRAAGPSGTLVGTALAVVNGACVTARGGAVPINTTLAHVAKVAANFGDANASNAITCEGLIVTIR